MVGGLPLGPDQWLHCPRVQVLAVLVPNLAVTEQFSNFYRLRHFICSAKSHIKIVEPNLLLLSFVDRSLNYLCSNVGRVIGESTYLRRWEFQPDWCSAPPPTRWRSQVYCHNKYVPVI